MDELGVTPVEEIDLHVNCLGKDSQKCAQSLKTSTASDPKKGPHRIWDRLGKRYGALHMVDAASKRKIENFAKSSPRTLRFCMTYRMN